MNDPAWTAGDDYARGIGWECPRCDTWNLPHEPECAGLDCGYVNEALAEHEAYYEGLLRHQPED